MSALPCSKQRICASKSAGKKSWSTASASTLAPGETLVIRPQRRRQPTPLSTLAGLCPPRRRQRAVWRRRCRPPGGSRSRPCAGLVGAVPERSVGLTVLETALTGRHPHLGRWDWNRRATPRSRNALAAAGLTAWRSVRWHASPAASASAPAIATLLTQAAPLASARRTAFPSDLNHQDGDLELFSNAARDWWRGRRHVLHDLALAHRFCDCAPLIFGDGRANAADALLTAATLSDSYGYRLRLARRPRPPLFLSFRSKS